MNYKQLITIIVIFGFSVPGVLRADVANTVHNLSASGPGSVRASSEDRICIFCHTPHNSSPSGPLWNRDDPGLNYIPYTSSTVIANPGQPTGASLLCLSCHDGTIALGKIVNPNMTIDMIGSTYMTGTDLIGTDLTNDHPVSFQYTSGLASQNQELVDPATLSGPVKLDGNSELQCTSCHDPHNNNVGKFLVMSNLRGALCTTCHTKFFWGQSPHNLSTATWNGTSPDPWPTTDWTTVTDNSCQNCHQPHNAGNNERLLNSAIEENNCRACHNGHVAQQDILSEFNKLSRHPIDVTTGTHDPKETAVVNSGTRHVECVDCHNPHAARQNGSPAGPLIGVRGVDTNGNEVAPITAEYQLCYRCHADSTGKPSAPTPRVHVQTNVRLEFDTANPSYHPVEGTGRNPNVPSLISPWTTSSVVKCTDCHSNNNGPGAGGVGPKGPHGSNYTRLLERRYDTNDPNPFSSSDYALCFKCHSENSLRNNASGFPHNLHVWGENAGCNVCHDPHGISLTQGTLTNNTHLINFNTSVVTGGMMGGGTPTFTDNGTFRGTCNLSCHGQQHMNYSY